MSKQLVLPLVALMLLSVTLSACGRKGALEPPASTMIENEQGERQEKPKEDKPFILDGLIKQKN